MKKKLIFVLLVILIVAMMAFTACNRNRKPNNNDDQTQDKTILDLYGDVKNAKNATQTITIKNGAVEIAIETLNYDFATGKVEITRKTLNTSDADELYTTTTETKDITGNTTAKLTRNLLSDVTETATTLKATVTNAHLNEVFGISASDVQGDARLELVAQGSHIVSITVSYTSSTGNTVAIVTTYVY